MNLSGIHHLTAISAAIKDNRRFYTQTLGMRLVKRSVNQDDVSSYHLFYADAKGSPGTDLTFFDWPAPHERRGTRSITLTSLRVNGARHARVVGRAPHRTRRAATTPSPNAMAGSRCCSRIRKASAWRWWTMAGKGDPPVVWDRSPVPAEHQIRGLGPIVMSVPTLAPTDVLLTKVMNMRQVRDYHASGDPAIRCTCSRWAGRSACGTARRGAARPAAGTPGRRRACITSPSARPMPITTPGRNG